MWAFQIPCSGPACKRVSNLTAQRSKSRSESSYAQSMLRNAIQIAKRAVQETADERTPARFIPGFYEVLCGFRLQ